MKQMDDKYRDPLDLRMMGYSIQEIAENFGNHAAECKSTASPGKADDSERNGGTR